MKRSSRNRNDRVIILWGMVCGIILSCLTVFSTLMVFKNAKKRQPGPESAPLVFTDYVVRFTNLRDLVSLKKDPDVELELTQLHASFGQYALKADFAAAPQPSGFRMEFFDRDILNWSEKHTFSFEVYNDTAEPVTLMVDIKSEKDYKVRTSSSQLELPANRGSQVRLAVSEIASLIDVDHIGLIQVARAPAEKPVTLYFANFQTSMGDPSAAQVSLVIPLGQQGDEKRDPINLKTLRLTLDPGKTLGTVSPFIYGSNFAAKMEFEMDVTQFTQDTGVTILRFPGGQTGWHWKSGKFDFTDRENEAPLSKIDNVIKFAQLAGSDLVIQVNIESGTPQEAAALVHYLNIEAKFPVKYWELGNEVYGDWDKAFMTPENYAEMIKRYSQAMKEVDPAIKIGADFGGPNYPDFDKTIIRLAGDYFDFISFHWYPNHISRDHPYQGRRHPLAEEVMANAHAVPQLVEGFRKLIRQYAPGREGQIEIAFLEWDGSWDGAASDLNYSSRGMIWTLANALFYADTLGQLALNGVTLSAHYTLQEVMFGLIRGWDKKAGWEGSRWDGKTIRPKALALKLFSRHWGDVLIDSRLEGSPTYTKSGDWQADSYRGEVPYVTAYSSRFSNQSKIAVVLVNKHSQENFSVKIHLDQALPEGEGTAWILNGPDLNSQNDGRPGLVAIEQYTVKGITQDFLYQVPAHSMSVLHINYKETPP